MPKNLPSQEGIRVLDLLDSLTELGPEDVLGRTFKLPDTISEASKHGESGPTRSEKLHYPLTEVRSGVNDDICCNRDQAVLLVERINEVAREMVNTGHKVISIITLANSFRMTCQNCLNGLCTHRDPNQPVPQK